MNNHETHTSEVQSTNKLIRTANAVLPYIDIMTISTGIATVATLFMGPSLEGPSSGVRELAMTNLDTLVALGIMQGLRSTKSLCEWLALR